MKISRFSQSEPVFKGSINRHKFVRMLKLNPIRHFSDFSITEYNQLSEAEIAFLRKEYRKIKNHDFKFLQESEDYHDYASDHAKERLNKLFGEGNYCVIVIGRSLSSIGKVLGYKIGEENVKNIPLSVGFKYCRPKYLKELKMDGSLRLYNIFLKKNGLSRDQILSNPDKHYVFVDYICSGDTIKGVRRLLNAIWQRPMENVHFMDITEGLKKLPNHKSLEHYMIEMSFKDYAFVPRALDLIQAQSQKLSSLFIPNRVKLFWFKVLDSVVSSNKALQGGVKT